MDTGLPAFCCRFETIAFCIGRACTTLPSLQMSCDQGHWSHKIVALRLRCVAGSRRALARPVSITSRRRWVDGAEGARTPDLLGAIQALSQLSYSP